MAMNDTERVPTPALDKLEEHREESLILSGFLDWLRDEHGFDGDFHQIIGDYLEIDPKEVSAEKDALYNTIHLPEGEFIVPEHAKTADEPEEEEAEEESNISNHPCIYCGKGAHGNWVAPLHDGVVPGTFEPVCKACQKKDTAKSDTD